MTVAICLQCGEIKHGAWSLCLNCGFEPDSDESLTKHLIMSDHYFTLEQLSEASAKIKNGEELRFNEDTLKEMWVTKDQIASMDKKMGRFFCICLALILTVSIIIFYFI